ncbi:hypothetical protein BN77_p11474 [Rhizobium mesoamericanum STM3625]|uniref:Uncharacterized protein n=1 Tax=Rhizobium mesoamericanum STM3625 TaxID=1211777 RepID=K0Q5Q9_9HYPH|nr:hypothetical protein BN77_p11474 [Rhizobium mesoamericanum STM3625]
MGASASVLALSLTKGGMSVTTYTLLEEACHRRDHIGILGTYCSPGTAE